MSEVFISYARNDRDLARALAKDLEELGYRVWWDAELVGSDDFQEVILAALAQAKAAVVIWSPFSTKSAFVRDEARFALHQKKLVAVRTPKLNILDIPFGFQGQHTDDLADRKQIARALTKLGAVPETHATPTKEAWETVKGNGRLKDVLDWLERNPESEKREEAFRLARRLMDAKPASATHLSNLSAFLSGLTFRLPRFQLTAQGNWTSIGYATGLVILLLIGLKAIDSVIEDFANSLVDTAAWAKGDAVITYQVVYYPVMTLALLGLMFIAHRGFSQWLGQKLLSATWVVASTFILLSAFFMVFAAEVVRNYLFWSYDFNSSGLNSGLFVCGALLALGYVALKVRAAR